MAALVRKDMGQVVLSDLTVKDAGALVRRYEGDLVELVGGMDHAMQSGFRVRTLAQFRWGKENPAPSNSTTGKLGGRGKKGMKKSNAFTPQEKHLFRGWARCPWDKFERDLTSYCDAKKRDSEEPRRAHVDSFLCVQTENRRKELVAFANKHNPDFAHTAGATWDDAAHGEMTRLYWTVAKMDEGMAMSAAEREGDLAVVREKANWELAQKGYDKPEVDARVVLHCSPIGDVHQHIEPGSVDVVITDPPYQESDLGCWEELAAFAVHALRPGGSLFAMSGTHDLPAVIDALRSVDGLSFKWIVCYEMEGVRSRFFDTKMLQAWKPVLWFVRDGEQPYIPDWGTDVVVAPSKSSPDREVHDWEQNVIGMGELIKRFVVKGDVVCDPFLGSGTTLVAALESPAGQLIGSDIEQVNIDRARGRLTGDAESGV